MGKHRPELLFGDHFNPPLINIGGEYFVVKAHMDDILVPRITNHDERLELPGQLHEQLLLADIIQPHIDPPFSDAPDRLDHPPQHLLLLGKLKHGITERIIEVEHIDVFGAGLELGVDFVGGVQV